MMCTWCHSALFLNVNGYILLQFPGCCVQLPLGRQDIVFSVLVSLNSWWHTQKIVSCIPDSEYRNCDTELITGGPNAHWVSKDMRSVNCLCAESIWVNKISRYPWGDAGSWNSYSWQIKTHVSYIVNTIADQGMKINQDIHAHMIWLVIKEYFGLRTCSPFY